MNIYLTVALFFAALVILVEFWPSDLNDYPTSGTFDD